MLEYHAYCVGLLYAQTCDVLCGLKVSFHLQNVSSVDKLVICRVVAPTTQEASTQTVLHDCDLLFSTLISCLFAETCSVKT